MGAALGATGDVQPDIRRDIGRERGRKLARFRKSLRAGRRTGAGHDPQQWIIGAQDHAVARGHFARTFDQPHPVFALVRRDVLAHLTRYFEGGGRKIVWVQ